MHRRWKYNFNTGLYIGKVIFKNKFMCIFLHIYFLHKSIVKVIKTEAAFATLHTASRHQCLTRLEDALLGSV